MNFSDFLKQQVKNKRCVYFDGGMGTMIQASGVRDYSIPEDLNFSHPELIKSIHRQYLDAGCNVLTANSFGANPIKNTGTQYTAEEYVTQAVKLMKEAVSEAEADGNSNRHFCAWDTGQIGKLMEPMGPLTFDEAYEAYKTAVVAAEKAGADLAIIETMSDLYEVKAAVLAVKENTSLPVIASMTFQPTLRTLTGADVLTCVTYLESLRVDAIGFNCGGSLEDSVQLTKQFIQYAHIPVLVQPNAGIPEVVDGKTIFLVAPKAFADAQLQNRKEGARILGGCCGTTPSHIKQLILEQKEFEADENFAEAELTYSVQSHVCSYNSTVECGGNAGPVIIGERINPTGKKKCKEALLAQNMTFVLEEAEKQIDAGSHILDVNVGLPGIDEAETMKKAVKTIQGTFNIPLQLDSSEPSVLEKALRYYNGKALVNSVNGKAESMSKVFPLIKKYGGAVVALCLDEGGIPQTAEGRAAVADKIISTAAEYGIPVRDIFIDTLTLTISSEQKTALETVRAISLLKQKYGSEGIQFVLGVSNISFGLPRRDIINSRFLAIALNAGLSACIINPLSEPMLESFYGYRALAGYDANCLSYIEKYNGSVYTSPAQSAASGTQSASGTQTAEKKNVPSENKTSPAESDSQSAAIESVSPDEAEFISVIEKGFKDKAGECAKKLLQDEPPVQIINRCIVPALDRVGKDFEKGRKFLPQLLMSADTVGAAFSVIKEHLAATGAEEESKGTVVLATVFGDIHDIGKNIVRAMLENYGYTVIDLGKNVPPETIVQTVLEKNIKLVGLSALMTTTVASMENTIRLLREELKKNDRECKIIAGGAVLTADYAEKIGADYYSKDAMNTVQIAKEVFGK